MANSTVHLDFLGREYEFNCPSEKREQLKLAAQRLENQLQTIKSSTQASREQVILMAALNLSFDSLDSTQVKNVQSSLDQEKRITELNQRVQTLINLIGDETGHRV
jgi:cell division protein ZapA